MFRVTDYPLLVFVISFVVLLLSVTTGGRLLTRLQKPDQDAREDLSLVVSATLTLLGLIIGFTFSMAIGRYDQRKNLEEEEANAIGTEYLRVDLLPAAEAARARALLKDYLHQRILFYTTRDLEAVRQIDARTAQLQKELWSTVVQAVGASPQLPPATLAAAGMNDVLNTQGYAQAAWWNRIPPAAWMLMLSIAVLSHMLVGYGARSVTTQRTFLLFLPLVMAIAFFLIADIDAPRGGVIRVQPQNLVSLAESLGSQMTLDRFSVWWILFGTISLVLGCIEIGILRGRKRLRSGKGKLEVSGAMVAAVMGLLSFLLAFTFNAAATRAEARKALVVREANAIEQTWRRAGFLEEEPRAAMRGFLRDYLDVRVKVVSGEMDLSLALRETGALHDKMWAIAEEAGRRNQGSIATGLLVQSLNEVIDLHLERVTMGVRNRVPPTIWATLYLLLMAAMVMLGAQIGQSEARHFDLEIAIAITFSTVLFLITDLDRPQEGLLRVSQEAMMDLQAKLHTN